MADTRLILHVQGTESDTTELPRADVVTALAEGRLDGSQLIWSPVDQSWKPASEWPDLVPQDTLILHVPGTEAETRQMPKAAVKEAVAKGELRRSQLIWNPREGAWRAVREMPDLLPGESVIVHIKGTENGTREMAMEQVRDAISKGDLTHSQLIWSARENAWRPVRELPELLPGETLILHVKGTEAETREVPKEKVRQAVSKGELSQSQLIWSAQDNQWREVRELPDLVPGETMILHVKGTEAQTTELPRQAVRAAVQRGELTSSQLIWRPDESTWKPVREIAELTPGESLILHVKGTEAQTSELPRLAVRTGIQKGEITHSQLIWSAPDNAWKQVRELPDLLPTQEVAPAPKRATQTGPPPKIMPGGMPAATAVPASGASPAMATGAPSASGSPPAVAGGSAPRPNVQTAARGAVAAVLPKAAAPGAKSHVAEEADGFHPVKWLCIGLAAVVLLLIAANYLLVDQRLESAYSATTYNEIPVYAHFGAFVQPNVIVIHIPATKKLTEANLADYLTVLARSTPTNFFTTDLFQRVALTSGWTPQYSFSGYTWRLLGEMQQEDANQRRDFILAQICDASGEPLVHPSSLNQAMQDERRDKVWHEFVAHFVAKP
jgi:hypothetical protein